MTEPVRSEDLLSAYVDGELGDAEREAVEGQLASSPDWRSVLGDVAEVRDLVRALASREAPSGFWAELLAAGPLVVGPHAVGPHAVGPHAVGPHAVGSARRTRTIRGVAWLGGAAAAAAVVAASVLPAASRVAPRVPALVDSHAARASVADDPIGHLAPGARPVSFRR